MERVGYDLLNREWSNRAHDARGRQYMERLCMVFGIIGSRTRPGCSRDLPHEWYMYSSDVRNYLELVGHS